MLRSAYIDAGSGSLMLQLLLGGFAAVGVAVKMFWKRILRVLRFRRAPDREG